MQGGLKREYEKEDEKRKSGGEPAKTGDVRSPFEIDRSRIVHCTAFRRLQGKTQVFGMGASDFFRTRLTHSLEVAQIGKGVALRLGMNTDLIEAACLAHDIGHPPFGHTGEKTLALLMWDYGGFEANAQNIRLLCRLESKFINPTGLNLTRATLDSILKYKTPFTNARSAEGAQPDKAKFVYDDDKELLDWASQDSPEGAKSIECKVMDWADDIAYSVHDLEDGIKSGMISGQSFDSPETNQKLKEQVRDEMKRDNREFPEEHWHWVVEKVCEASKEWPSARERKARRKGIASSLINDFINSASLVPGESQTGPARYRVGLKIQEEAEQRCSLLKYLVWVRIINNERVATLERKSEQIVHRLFDEFVDEDSRTVNLYPDDFRERYTGPRGRHRLACDYISGMTDSFALKVYSRLFEPEIGSVFDIL